MPKSIKQLLLGLVVVFIAWVMPTVSHAQQLGYSALKYGTKQTSMASGYFVHPATVTVKDHAYVVTMDIKTAKKLTSWPVKVLSIDGQSPENVRRTKDSAGNSHLYYSFTTTNLKRDVNAKLAIDVPDVYKAKHLITFKFKTGDLPALTRAKSAATTAQSQPATTRESSSVKATRSTASHPKRHSSRSASKASVSKSVPSATHHQAASHSTTSQSPQTATNADQVPQQKTHWGGLIGGAIAIVVLVGGGSWWYFGRH